MKLIPRTGTLLGSVGANFEQLLHGNRSASRAAVCCVPFDNDNDLTLRRCLSSRPILMSFTDECASDTGRSILPTMPALDVAGVWEAARAGAGGTGVCFDFSLFIENAGSILEKWDLAGSDLARTTKLSLCLSFWSRSSPRSIFQPRRCQGRDRFPAAGAAAWCGGTRLRGSAECFMCFRGAKRRDMCQNSPWPVPTELSWAWTEVLHPSQPLPAVLLPVFSPCFSPVPQTMGWDLLPHPAGYFQPLLCSRVEASP